VSTDSVFQGVSSPGPSPLWGNDSYWGGPVSDAPVEDQDFFGDKLDDRQAVSVQIAREVIEEQHEAGNELFAKYVPVDGIEAALAQYPDLFGEMIEAALAQTSGALGLLARGQGFYEAICRVLLRRRPAEGVALCKRLMKDPAFAFIQQDTEIRLLDLSLFAAAEEPEIDR